MAKRLRVAVVGAGVNGLTCAHELSVYCDVTIVSAERPEHTTSQLATAIWHVYLVDPNDQDVIRWSTKTLEKLIAIGADSPEAAVYPVRGFELFRRSQPKSPSWSHIPPYFRMLGPAEISRYSGVKWGYEIEAPLAEMASYLPWLVDRLQEKQVAFDYRRIASFEEIGKEFDAVVNCTGLGSRALLNDDELIGVRGQYLIVASPDAPPVFYIGDDEHPDGMSFMIPRRDGICIGGTEEYGIEELEFVADVQEMLKRASETSESLRGLTEKHVIRKVVGLRPYRISGVRLARERLTDGRPLVHNYGHGGSGFSLAWGCAEDVTKLVMETE